MTETLSIASLFAYACAGVAFVGGLFPDCVIAAAAGILATVAALILHWITERRADARRGRPAHCQDLTPDEGRR